MNLLINRLVFFVVVVVLLVYIHSNIINLQPDCHLIPFKIAVWRHLISLVQSVVYQIYYTLPNYKFSSITNKPNQSLEQFSSFPLLVWAGSTDEVLLLSVMLQITTTANVYNQRSISFFFYCDFFIIIIFFTHNIFTSKHLKLQLQKLLI